MPTHRDELWEQDARKARGRTTTTRWPDPAAPQRPEPPAPRSGPREGTWIVGGLATVIAAVLGVFAVGDDDAATTAPAAAPTPVGSVLSLHSRRLTDGGLEAWGRTDAPDGSTVTVRLDGIPRGWPVLARGGTFYLRTPAAPGTRTQRVTATVSG